MGSAIPTDATTEEREAIILKDNKFIEDLAVLARQLTESIRESFRFHIRLSHPNEHAYTKLKTYHNCHKKLNNRSYQHTNSQARQLYGVPSVWRTCKK